MPARNAAISSRVTVQNPRPRKYASAAKKQAAFRARFPTLCVRVEPKTADTIQKIGDASGRTQQETMLSLVKFALTNRDFVKLGLTEHKQLPRIEEPRKANPMKRKPTPAQLAARERFAEMARSGAFKKKAKRNPAKKTVSQKISQLTREGYPQKQAVAIALSEQRAGKVKRNPAQSMQTFEIIDTTTGESEGFYKAADAQLAFEVWARSNGYKSFSEMKQKEKFGARGRFIAVESQQRKRNPRASNPAKYRDTARGLPENRVLYSVHNPTQRASIATGFFTTKQKAMQVAQALADSTGKTYAVSRLERT